LLVALFLAACGGGDGSRGPADAAPDAAATPDAAIPDASVPDAADPVDAGGCAPTPVDVLYVVDTSPDMAAARSSLLARLAGTLDALRAGWGKHTLHVGVLSSDLGTGDAADCPVLGDDAILQADPIPDASPCDASYPAFLSDPVDAADVACVGALEPDGCAVQRPFDAVLRGLRERNDGFLQGGSILVLAILSATEDCSTDDESVLAGIDASACDDPDLGLVSPGALADRVTTVRRPSALYVAGLAGVAAGLGGCATDDLACIAALPIEGCETTSARARPTARIVSTLGAIETLAPRHVAVGSLCDEDWTVPFATIGEELGKALCTD
jgi:hypothetical protein